MMPHKLAFSAPDRNPDERRTLMTGFRTHGYDGLQLKRMQFADDLDDPARFLARWSDAPGVASGLITAARLDDAGIADLRRVIRFGAAVGSERVVFCHAEPRAPLSGDDITAFGRTLAGLGREARSLGVLLSLHHHYEQPVMHRPDFDRFFEGVAGDDVGLTVDTAHLVKSGITDVAEVIRSFGPRIDTIHVKDIAGTTFVPLGMGDIDFDPVFRAVAEAAPGAWLCADEESGADIEGAMVACRSFLDDSLKAHSPGRA